VRAFGDPIPLRNGSIEETHQRFPRAEGILYDGYDSAIRKHEKNVFLKENRRNAAASGN
jgi:hypothetical protein